MAMELPDGAIRQNGDDRWHHLPIGVPASSITALAFNVNTAWQAITRRQHRLG